MLEAHDALFRQHDTGTARQARYQLARVGQDLVDRFALVNAELGIEIASLVVGQVADFEQAVDEQA